MKNHEAYQRAKERVEAKIGYYIHLSIVIIISFQYLGIL
jgi:hypothetical protein